MKKSYIIGIVVAIIVVIGISLGSGYNKMVKENENVESAAAQIDVQLKRRTDLIPNLINNTTEVKIMKCVCPVCGYVYDEALGDPDHGIAPGTKWEDLPADFECPLCGVGKDNFSQE